LLSYSLVLILMFVYLNFNRITFINFHPLKKYFVIFRFFKGEKENREYYVHLAIFDLAVYLTCILMCAMKYSFEIGTPFPIEATQEEIRFIQETILPKPSTDNLLGKLLLRLRGNNYRLLVSLLLSLPHAFLFLYYFSQFGSKDPFWLLMITISSFLVTMISIIYIIFMTLESIHFFYVLTKSMENFTQFTIEWTRWDWNKTSKGDNHHISKRNEDFIKVQKDVEAVAKITSDWNLETAQGVAFWRKIKRFIQRLHYDRIKSHEVTKKH